MKHFHNPQLLATMINNVCIWADTDMQAAFLENSKMAFYSTL